MNYFKSKSLYNIIVNTGNSKNGQNGYITYHNVSGIEKFRKFIDSKYPSWVFANVYDKNAKINGKPKFIETITNKKPKTIGRNNLTFDF